MYLQNLKTFGLLLFPFFQDRLVKPCLYRYYLLLFLINSAILEPI